MQSSPEFKVSILFAREDRLFSAGEALEGKVIVNSGEDRFICGITVYFIGEAKVNFKPFKVLHSSEETLLSSELTLFGGSDKEIILPEGQSEYPFTFVLPDTLPSTVFWKSGEINYFCFAELKTSENSEKITPIVSDRECFKIIADLNRIPLAKAAVELESKIGLTNFGFPNGSICYSIKILKSGFAPGELIKFSVEVDNQSREKVETSAYLQQVICYKAKPIFPIFAEKYRALHAVRISNVRISAVSGIFVECGENKLWTVQNLRTPPGIPDSQESSQLLSISYKLIVTFQPQYSRRINCKIPLVIGTISIDSLADGDGDLIFYNYSFPPPPYEQCKEILPPSYEEATQCEAL